MSGRLAVSARALARGFALGAAYFVLALGPSCGREQFDLLQPAGAGNGGTASLASAPPSSGNGQGSAGSAGRDTSSGGRGGAPPAGNGGGIGGNGQPNGGEAPCLAGQRCTDGGLSCPPTVPSCQRCQNSSDCTADANAHFCDLEAGRCVECRLLDNDCAAGLTCNPLTLRCERSCEFNKDCPSPYLLCSTSLGEAPDAGICVECRYNSDCLALKGPSAAICYAGYCVECSDSTSCTTADKPLCEALHCVANH